MAVVSLTHNINTLEDFEGAGSPTFATFGGSGPGAGENAGLHYEGAQSATRRIGSTSTDAGFHATIAVTEDFSAATSTVWWVKAFTALAAVITAGGTRVHVGDTTSVRYSYQVGDDGTMGGGQFLLPPKGGYVFIPIQVRVNAWRNLPDAGSPDVTVADVYSMQHNVSATTGAGLSQSLDAIHTSGDGLFLVGGDTAPQGKFQDFLDADEGAGLTGAERVGMWTSQSGTFFVYGPHVIGRTDAAVSTLTEFVDALQTIVFPGGFVGAGFNELELDLATASTIITWTNVTIIGRGRGRKKVYFDTDHDVDNTVDSIDITAHGFLDGDQLSYSKEGGTSDIGPDDVNGEAALAVALGGRGTGPMWYAIEGASADLLQISAIADNAYGASPTAVVLTADGSGFGERHSLTRTPDTRPDITVTGSTGAATWDGCTFIRPAAITCTAGLTWTGGTVVGGELVTVGGALIDGVTFVDPTPALGEHFMAATATDMDSASNGVKNCEFNTTTGEGHAIKIISGTGSIAFSNNTYSGYFATDEDDTGGWSFNASTDVTGGATDTITITGHGFATADPIHYSDEGGTVLVPLTDNELYFVRSVDVNTVALYNTARAATDDVDRISLTPGTSEVHKLYSANATIWNDTGNAITLNITDSGGTPTIRNTSGSTTLVVNSVNITITCLDAAGDPVQTAQVAVYEGTDPASPGAELMNEDTNASGVATEPFGFTGDQAIIIRIRKNTTGAARYLPVATTGTIDANGYTLVRTLVLDTIVEA